MAVLATHKIVIGVVIGIVVVLLVGWLIMWVTGRGSATLTNALMEAVQARSMHTTVDLVMNLPPRLRGQNRPLTLVTVKIDGDVVKSEDRTPELAGTLKIEARGRGNAFFVDGDVRILKDTVAFRLSEFPSLLNPSGSLSEKWTYVNVPFLITNNSEQVRTLIAGLGETAVYEGTTDLDGTRVWRYRVPVEPAQEDTLVNAFVLSVSGNRGLHTLSRFLRANNIESLDFYVDADTEQLRQMAVHFVRPLDGEEPFDFARLTLSFRDFGVATTIDRPPQEVFVRPDVFTPVFGTGEITPIQ